MSEAGRTAIGAEAVLFSDLFYKGQFLVPWHQRYYDWAEENVAALLKDIKEAVKDKRRCYFVGAVILAGKNDGKFEINDGQQRMITVSLICAALCRRFAEDTADAQREAFALRMLFDLHPDRRRSLNDAEDYVPRIAPPVNDKVMYHRMIRGNNIGTNGKLTSAWRTIDDFFGTTNEDNWWEEYFDYLREHVEVACLTVPRDIDPNAVFETINCRGKPLDALDLIRNFIYSYFSSESEEQKRETIHTSLERIRQVFPTRKTTSKAEEYVRCRMQCQFGFLSKDTFYEDVRRRVREELGKRRNKRTPSEYVFELVQGVSKGEDLELYRRLTSPHPSPEFLQEFQSRSRTTNSPRNLSVFLRELKNYSVTNTLVFALMEKYVHQADKDKMRSSARVVSKNLSRLASFVVRTALVAPKFEPSHFEKSFADFAAEIRRSKEVPDAEFAGFLRQCDRNEHNVLDDQRFKEFLETSQLRGNAKIKALLLGLNRIDRPDAVVINEAGCAVEHVLPTGKSHWPGWTGFGDVDASGWIHRIGNLALTAKADSRPGPRFNASFANKVGVYRDSSIGITRELAELDSWSPEAINIRQRRMASQAVLVWSFS